MPGSCKPKWGVGVAGLLAAALGLAACAPAPIRPPLADGEVKTRASGSRAQVVRVARSRLGAPYRYGEEGPIAFDCSGLVHYAYDRAGLDVPRTVRAQRRHISPVPASRVRPGDLLFFRFAGKVNHVGIYVGDGRFVHAPKTGSRVSYGRLERDYWQDHLVGAGQFF